MQKSFIERIFPHSPTGVLPRYEDGSSSRASTSDSPPRIQLREPSLSPESPGRRSTTLPSLQATPLSASIVHHDDPFLPVERAARALEETIQSFLDAQSDGLNASLTGDTVEDVSSVGSPTPTPSVATPSRSTSMPRTMPVRQPVPKKISLRGARRGLSKAMDEFAKLKAEELDIISSELISRQTALRRGRRFQGKKKSLLAEMNSIQGEDSSNQAKIIRAEADRVKVEMQEVETKLFELRARHRQLVTQADQLENSIDSKLSSYKSSLTLVEKDMQQFLRRPPVTHSLPMFKQFDTAEGGMYALKPERRTLEMAADQWTAEQELLSHRKSDVESEREALQEGVKIWRSATQRIAEFEKSLRHALKAPDSKASKTLTPRHEDPQSAILSQLNDLVSSLQADLDTAESRSWNLLICCLGAELEALEQGRLLLGGAPAPASQPQTRAQPNDPHHNPDDIRDTPYDETSNAGEDLLNNTVLRSPSAGSNQSLEDTLEAFGNGLAAGGVGEHEDKGKGRESDRSIEHSTDLFGTPPLSASAGVAPNNNLKRTVTKDESEDDDPSPAFFLSHS